MEWSLAEGVCTISITDDRADLVDEVKNGEFEVSYTYSPVDWDKELKSPDEVFFLKARIKTQGNEPDLSKLRVVTVRFTNGVNAEYSQGQHKRPIDRPGSS